MVVKSYWEELKCAYARFWELKFEEQWENERLRFSQEVLSNIWNTVVVRY